MADTPAPFGARRRFLFLQGPHGPFFARLGAMLRKTGAEVWRVGFNRGDQAFWRDRESYIPFRDDIEVWPERLTTLLGRHQITDIVIYSDVRPFHAEAVRQAKARGLRIHVFEEGYMRPHWVTYERGGSNGNSRLMDLTIPEMATLLDDHAPDGHPLADRWGDMRQHVFYGAFYHFFVLFLNRGYPGFVPHRGVTVASEFRLYLKRLLLMPWFWLDRILATRRIRAGGFPYHVALLQLDHDASFRAHSPFASSAEFLSQVIQGFATGAPPHHHLVIKAHPLEDGRTDLRGLARTLAREAGVQGRVHYLRGGKLARLLDTALSAVTVNSTAGQQVLYRNLPLRAFGTAIYSKPELVSDQGAAAFFAAPQAPDADSYRILRKFLLNTSQISGGFYSRRGRQQLLRGIVDRMLAAHDPYEALYQPGTAQRQHLRQISGA